MPPAEFTPGVAPRSRFEGSGDREGQGAAIRYRPDIDGLRALAVIGIIVYHFLPGSFPGGLTGVDIFFVISGYLISLILIKQPRLDAAVLKTFYARRIKRIFPALLLVMGCALAFGWIALYADEFKELGKHVVAGAGFVSNFVYLKEAGYFDAGAEQKPLLHLWSLAVEEQFYIVWPLLLIVLGQRKRQLLAVRIMWALSFVGNVYLSYTNVDAAFYLPFTRFWEILTGAALAFSEVAPNGSRRVFRRLGAWIGLVLMIGSIALVKGDELFPGWQALIPVLGAYLVIRGGNSRASSLILANRPMVWLGLISYPLYLWHWPIFAFLTITELQLSATQKGIGIGLTLLLATLTYYLLEKPVRHRKGRTTLTLLVLMAAIGFAGYKVYKRNGLDYRPVNYEAYKKHALAWLGFMHSNAATSQGAVAFDRQHFDSLHPEYASQLQRLALHMRTDNAFFQKLKHDFSVVNQKTLGENELTGGPGESKRRVVIIGDSHAENLYWSLKLTHSQYEFTLFTASGCTPILSRYRDEDNRCRVLINTARDFLKRERTDLVILAARWPESYARVADDLAFYQTVSPHVALAGPSLTFTSDVSKIMLRYTEGDIIEHVNRFIDTDKFRQNAEMKIFAAGQRVGFIDELQPLSRDGVFRITATGQELFIFDSSHLTKSGAIEMGHQLLDAGVLEELLK